MDTTEKTPARRRAVVRAAAAAAVLAVALTVALWPRDRGPAVPDDALVTARAGAALDPCPTGTGPAGGRLVGLALPCLGSPGTVDVGAATPGRPVLLNVWASWCTPCREEIPVLEAYRHEPGAVEVLGVDADVDPAAGLAMMAALGGHYPSVHDGDVRLRRELAGPRSCRRTTWCCQEARSAGSIRRPCSAVRRRCTRCWAATCPGDAPPPRVSKRRPGNLFE